ncbi:MAG: hypothetical protein ABIV63_16410 [Caldimonas sp.]
MSPGAQIGLWFTVVGFGVYHGLNPAMGWPLAVANGLTARRGSAVLATLIPLGAGHLLAMSVVLAPFVLLAWYVEWSRAVRAGAAVLVLAFGIFKLVRRRHPRFLARVRPSRLMLWSFLMATAHGAGLMLLPITLALCARPAPRATVGAGAHDAVMSLAATSAGTAMLVALLHTLAMLLSGLAIAWIVYRYLGLRFLRQSWFNLDALWAASLVVTGGAGLVLALTS